MEGYRALTGEYPYDESYVYCPPAFVRYLRREGLKPEAYDDVPRLVTAAISTAAPYWGALRRALCDSARDWACQELFLERVGSARALAEAAELGWADSRLTHAVVTLQRLVRFRRAAPPGRLDLAAFERLHHVRDPSWAAAHIHLASFAETDLRFEDRDEMAEVSFVRWNRRCIPGFIFAFSRFEGRGSRPHTFELSSGVEAVVGCDLGSLFHASRERLYRQNIHHLLEDDALAKTGILIRLLAQNGLAPSPELTVLKFLELRLQEPPPAWIARAALAPGKVVAQCYLDRLDRLPLRSLQTLFATLPACLASHGRDLLYRFSKVNVDTLGAAEIQRWYAELVADSVADVCRMTGVEAGHLLKFLRRTSPMKARGPIREAMELARSVLRAAHRRVVKGEPLYSQKVWAEPVLVTSVTLVSDREASLGE